MFRTTVALIKIAAFMIGKNGLLRKAKKLDREGKIAERDELVNGIVPVWARYVFEVTKSDVEVEGLEKLPKDKAVVFIANHQGLMDIPLLYGYSGKPMAFVAKIELSKIPLLSSWMKLLQCTFIDRKSMRASLQAINDAAANVSKGYSQMIFPEGTRSKGGHHIEFKPGSFKLAFKSKSPVVPVTIDGTWRIYEENNDVRPAHVKMIIHDPIDTDGMTKEEMQELPSRVERIVCAPLSENESRK
ncbi:MAG: 1-acyl-sn-glycerol-3-phosphate acyltransferase [Treponema sp.]|nr:1-acyl-sn-glycerol-3-phosphate acyltransferase [Treponema sp.]MBR1713716.1 1-acyl-sn-glycerol-3-phosphate acyltransferase [Treponema sp.]